MTRCLPCQGDIQAGYRMPANSLKSSGQTVTKDELRAELERQEKRYKDVYGGEVTLYAAQPDPEKKPWRKRRNLLDKAFDRELEKIEEQRLKKEQESAFLES